MKATDYRRKKRDAVNMRSTRTLKSSRSSRKASPVRSPQSWQLLKAILARFDLVAIQEIMDDLSGFTRLQALLGEDNGMVVSDVTGVKPGENGNSERLGFLFNWKRIQRTALASDITYDRSNIAGNLYEHRAPFADAWDAHSYNSASDSS